MLTKRNTLIVCVTLCFTILFGSLLAKESEELSKALKNERGEDGRYPVLLILKDQYDTQILYNQVKDMKKQDRRKYAVSTLKNHSIRTQKNVKQMIQQLELSGAVTEVKYNWIVNTIGLKADPKAIKLLSEHKDIAQIEYDPLTKTLIEPVSSTDLVNSGAEREIVWNLNKMRVPFVWDMGYYGEGVLVAVIDTGINYNHEDIKDRMWVHDDFPYHGYSFIDNSYNTLDDYDHGTHCAGTIAGDGTSGYQTGVAPKSKIMSLKIYDADGHSTLQITISAIQFAIDYKADIMNMSFGWSNAEEGIRALWRSTMENILSVGIPAMVAAGNEAEDLLKDKPIPHNIRTPGDCPPPWLHPDQTIIGGLSSTISVGAVNKEDVLANFSSHGPVTWQNTDNYFDYKYNPGIGLIRPDICAPGVDVASLSNKINTGYSVKSGTSMAAPNSAGVVALMLSKDPELTPEDISRILELTVTKLSDTKSNLFGTGRVDAYRAVNKVLGENPPYEAFHPYPAVREESISLTPKLTWFNGGGATSYRLFLGTDYPPTNVINGIEITEVYHQITEPLEYGLTYNWRVDAINQYGETRGEEWKFTTTFKTNENFEDGTFKHPDWKFSTTGSGAENWFVDDSHAFLGEKAARSGKINNNSTTMLSITLNVLERGVIKFARKVSSEAGSDYLRFYIGNELKGEWTGDQDWEYVVYPLVAGVVTFRWVYSKDQMGSGGEDAAWIDEIVFPKHPKPPVAHVPENFTTNFDFETYTINWDLEKNEDVNPIEFMLYGCDIFGRNGDEGEFVKLNENYLSENSYKVNITEAGEYQYYLRAAYRVLGKLTYSENSEIYTVTIHPPLDEPTISPESGEYNQEQLITIEAQEDAIIFYTTDGSTPTFDSERYEEPFVVNESCIVKAKVFGYGYLPSEIAQAVYEINLTSVENDNALPVAYALKLYPNPYITDNTSRSANSVTIAYSVPEEVESLNITIRNIKGQVVKTYVINSISRGEHSVSWNLTDTKGTNVANGIYLVSLKTGSKQMYNKFIILK